MRRRSVELVGHCTGLLWAMITGTRVVVTEIFYVLSGFGSSRYFTFSLGAINSFSSYKFFYHTEFLTTFLTFSYYFNLMVEIVG